MRYLATFALLMTTLLFGSSSVIAQDSTPRSNPSDKKTIIVPFTGHCEITSQVGDKSFPCAEKGSMVMSIFPNGVYVFKMVIEDKDTPRLGFLAVDPEKIGDNLDMLTVVKIGYGDDSNPNIFDAKQGSCIIITTDNKDKPFSAFACAGLGFDDKKYSFSFVLDHGNISPGTENPVAPLKPPVKLIPEKEA